MIAKIIYIIEVRSPMFEFRVPILAPGWDKFRVSRHSHHHPLLCSFKTLHSAQLRAYNPAIGEEKEAWHMYADGSLR